MKVIHKIGPVLILLGYFYILYEGYFLCQFGGVRYHGQKMAVGAAVMAVGFLFWLITRKKAKEQQAENPAPAFAPLDEFMDMKDTINNLKDEIERLKKPTSGGKAGKKNDASDE